MAEAEKKQKGGAGPGATSAVRMRKMKPDDGPISVTTDTSEKPESPKVRKNAPGVIRNMHKEARPAPAAPAPKVGRIARRFQKLNGG